MTRHTKRDWDDEPDDDGNESLDRDSWDDDLLDEDAESDDEPTVPCPYCRREIHEDSSRCPYCERYLSSEDAPSAPKPWWIWLGVGLGLYAVYRWIVG